MIVLGKQKITKKVYNNVIKFIYLDNNMDTTFMNSEKSKISHPHSLLLTLPDKMDFAKR